MSAQSRALGALADHFEYLAEQACTWGFEPPAVYNAQDVWEMAADMARRTAADQAWRSRALRCWYRLTHTGGY